MSEQCNRKRLAAYLANKLELEERLDLLFHLDHCIQCWEEVYNAQKAQHPHYYRQSSRAVKISDKELQKIDTGVEEELIEVA